VWWRSAGSAAAVLDAAQPIDLCWVPLHGGASRRAKTSVRVVFTPKDTRRRVSGRDGERGPDVDMLTSFRVSHHSHIPGLLRRRRGVWRH
jgi:hypothetical protein